MSLPPRALSELHDLFNLGVEGELDEAGRARLNGLLREDEVVRDVYLRYLSLHAALTWDSVDVAEGVPKALSARPRELARTVHVATSLHPDTSPKRLFSRRQWGLLATIGLVVVVVFYGAFSIVAWSIRTHGIPQRETTAFERIAAAPRAVASLGAMRRCKWKNNAASASWAPNAALFRGQSLELLSGTVEVNFADGARVVLSGPAHFTLETPSRGALAQGNLVARVPKHAVGFEVQTPNATIVDRGTEFCLDVAWNGDTEVQVLHGMVSVTPESDPAASAPATTLRGGQAGRVIRDSSGGMSRVELVRFDRRPHRAAQGTDADPDAEDAQHRLAQFVKWTNLSHQWREDPSLLAYYTFNGPTYAVPPRIVNQAAATAGRFDAVIHNATWHAGRWMKKGSLAFHTADQWAEVDIPGEFDSVSLVASVYLEPSEQYFRGLFLTNWQRRGQIAWEFHDRRNFQFGVCQADDFFVPRVLEEHHLNRWLQIAGIYDAQAQRITLMIDGQVVAEEPIRQPCKLLLGPARIGNFIGGRSLGGRMDELFIFSRALTPEEVRQLTLESNSQN